jgi:hypothetical protein
MKLLLRPHGLGFHGRDVILAVCFAEPERTG